VSAFLISSVARRRLRLAHKPAYIVITGSCETHSTNRMILCVGDVIAGRSYRLLQSWN